MEVVNNKVEEARALFPFEDRCYNCGSDVRVGLKDVTKVETSQFDARTEYNCGACGKISHSGRFDIARAAKLLRSLDK